jgi:hypothetical protein
MSSKWMALDGYDDCLVGVVERFGQPPILCYDTAKIIRKLIESGSTEEEARENFDVNIAGAWLGDGTPCFLEFVEKDVRRCPAWFDRMMDWFVSYGHSPIAPEIFEWIDWQRCAYAINVAILREVDIFELSPDLWGVGRIRDDFEAFYRSQASGDFDFDPYAHVRLLKEAETASDEIDRSAELSASRAEKVIDVVLKAALLLDEDSKDEWILSLMSVGGVWGKRSWCHFIYDSVCKAVEILSQTSREKRS